MDMYKHTKSILLGVGFAALLTVTFLFNEDSSLLRALDVIDNGEWVHYAKREATQTTKGIREYWVRCGGGYQFEKPESSNIREATSYDESGFTANDPRYIIYIDDSKSVFYKESTSSYDYTEVPQLDNYTVQSVPTTLGEETRMEFYKSDISPLYSAKITRVTSTIGSNADLKTLQDAENIADITNAYYVFTADLTNPSSTIKARGGVVPIFTGTIDGRNHNITNPSFWDYRMLGVVKDSTIKNLNFKNISVFSTLCYKLDNSTLDNVNFYTSSSLNSWSNVGMICDGMYNYTKLKNCYIDYGTNDLRSKGCTDHATAPLAAVNYTAKDNEMFENTTIKCLSTINLFLGDYHGRSLRPESPGLTYVTSFSFIKNGTLNYSIKYLADNAAILEAANYIKSAVYRVTGKTLSMTSFTSLEKFSKDTAAIVIGSDSSLEENLVTVPENEGDYVVKAVGKAIYINAHDDYAYQAATLAFLEKGFGYDSVYKERTGSAVYFSSVTDKNNVDLGVVDVTTNSPFKYRRYDSGDGAFLDQYTAGYTCRGYSSNDLFFDVRGIADDPHMSSDQRFHTSIMLLYPGTYMSSHSKWFLTNSIGTHPSKTNDSYYAYQLCFTAHGDSSEYNAMVDEMAARIEDEYANRKSGQQNAHILMLGTGDSYNYCQCLTCKAKTTQYGSIAGTVINFLNDVQAKLDAYYGKREIDLCTFAYTSYKEAPVKNGEATIQSNVPVMIAPIEANFTYPINNDTYNSETHTMFENWSKVGRLYSWLYETNFSNYLYPYNSFEAMTESLKYMADKGVELAYVQGQHNLGQYRTGFNQLKVYLKGKFMANPYTSNYAKLVNRYFANYFKEGATEMRTFFNELVARMSQFDTNATYKEALYKNNVRSVYSNIYSSVLWDKTQLERWASLCNTAYGKATNAETKRCILAESIFPRWCLITTFAGQYDSSTLLSMRQSFKTDATSLNMTLTKESYTVDTLQSYYDSWGI